MDRYQLTTLEPVHRNMVDTHSKAGQVSLSSRTRIFPFCLQADITTSFADGLLQGVASGGALVDLALISFGTLAHCLTTEAAVSCFTQVAK